MNPSASTSHATFPPGFPLESVAQRILSLERASASDDASSLSASGLEPARPARHPGTMEAARQRPMQPTPSMPFTSRYDRAPKSDARLEEGPRKLAHALAELDAVAWRDNPHVQRLVAYLDQAHIPRDTAVRVLPNIVVTRDGLRFYDAEAETHGIVTDAVTRTVTCALIDPPSPSHAKVVLCLRQAAREARSGRLISLDPSHLSRDKIEQALAALPERLEVVPTRSPSAQRWDRVRDELSGLPYALCLAPLAPIVTPVACALAIAIADD